MARPDAYGRIRIQGRTIYILPTRYGLLFGLLLVTLLVASINYASNPAFLLTFLLGGLFFQAIFHTWRNLRGIEVRWLGAERVFAGDRSQVRLQLLAPGRPRPAIQLGFTGEAPVLVHLPADRAVTVALPWTARHRGLHRPGRLVVESRYPLGLLRAWSYLEPAGRILVWPKPAEAPPLTGAPSWEGSLEGDRGVGADDFQGHRDYRPGDSPSHIHWKALAADKGLLVKQFGGDRMERTWLDFEALAPLEAEARLSALAGAVAALAAGASHFGLRLPAGVGRQRAVQGASSRSAQIGRWSEAIRLSAVSCTPASASRSPRPRPSAGPPSDRRHRLPGGRDRHRHHPRKASEGWRHFRTEPRRYVKNR